MSADYTYSNIEALIRDALGDDVDDKVKIKPVETKFNAWQRGPATILGIQLLIEDYVDRFGFEGKRTVFRRVMLKDGKLDLDKFRAKYQEVIEAWKPHEAAIDARTAELEAQARIKAQRELYADAGEELVAALEWVEWPCITNEQENYYEGKSPIMACYACHNLEEDGHESECRVARAIAKTKL